MCAPYIACVTHDMYCTRNVGEPSPLLPIFEKFATVCVYVCERMYFMYVRTYEVAQNVPGITFFLRNTKQYKRVS
jgi:hypothetical protein